MKKKSKLTKPATRKPRVKKEPVVSLAKSRKEIEKLVPQLPNSFSVLAIDQSITCSGIVFLDRYNVIYDAIQPRQTLGIGRLSEIEQKLTRLIVEHKPAIIVMEGYSRNSRFRREEMGEAGAIVKLVTYRFQLPLYVIAPKSTKLFLTGNDKAEKDEMVRNCPLTPRLVQEKRSRKVIEATSDAYALAIAMVAITIDPESDIAYQRLI